MKRTTLKLDEVLLRELKLQAARQGTSLQAVVNDLLRRGLKTPARPGYRLEWEGWDGVQRPGLDLFDRDALFEAMEADQR